MQRLDDNQIAAMKSRRIVMQLKKAPAKRESYAKRAKVIMKARNTQRARSLSVPPCGGMQQTGCILPQIRCASPSLAAQPRGGYSVAARQLSRHAQRDSMYRGWEKQLCNLKVRTIVDVDEERIRAEKMIQTLKNNGQEQDGDRIRRQLLDVVYQPQCSTYPSNKNAGKLPVVPQRRAKHDMSVLKSKYGLAHSSRPTTWLHPAHQAHQETHMARNLSPAYDPGLSHQHGQPPPGNTNIMVMKHEPYVAQFSEGPIAQFSLNQSLMNSHNT